MSLMDYIRRYREEKDKKDIFLKGLAARIKSLETKIDYKAIIDDVSTFNDDVKPPQTGDDKDVPF